jgi:hypothetical protein
MHKITQLSAVAVLATALSTLISVDASATANRTFVSGQGSDSNPCSLGAPCRSFAQAITQTAPGGEITVLDSAGYGVVTITQSVTITNPGGVEAGITTTSGEDAITIDATLSATVTLRGLTLEGGGVGGHGIILTSTAAASGTLNIIDRVIKDFTNSGIAIAPAFGNSQTEYVLIANSFVLNNMTYGINLVPQNANSLVIATINQTTASRNGTGITLGTNVGNVEALINNSHADMNIEGINLVNATAVIKNSSILENINNPDFANAGVVSLYNNNIMSSCSNNGEAFTDGTNNIVLVTGNGLIKQAQQ